MLYDIFEKCPVSEGGFPDLVVSQDCEVMPMARLAVRIKFRIGAIAGNVNQSRFLPKSPRGGEHTNRGFGKLQVRDFSGNVRFKGVFLAGLDDIAPSKFKENAFV